MSASETATHLKYLTDAAHLLAFTAPETSAYLVTQRNGLMLANDLEQSDTQLQHACAACGRILILGQNSTLKLETKKASHRTKKRHASAVHNAHPTSKSDTQVGPSKLLTCETCGRYTRVRLAAPGPISRKKPSAVMINKTTTETSKQPPSANANSKKRAKSRKAGLQALLSRSQTGGSGARAGLGLSLSDFMKK